MNMNLLMLGLLELIVFSLTFNQGFWTCALMMFNITFAGVMAFNYAAPLANLLIGMYEPLYYMAEFMSLWVLFLIFFAISRAVTDKLSPVPVRVGGETGETILNYAFSVWVSCMFTIWVCFTLVVAPIAADGFQSMMSPGAVAHTAAFRFGGWYVAAPGKLGMGLLGRPISMTDYMNSRLDRSNELKTKKGVMDVP
ncbi:hypothetical protein [Blastopirellula retiformator]|uniref:Colicin V production protein n=1 Tax=Blastopirellula retiformator TaxID=2527970 RepID=A0A5C5V2Q8_9BACT|nr:hypothetical protein [Blastopirellula retiformator]TWT32896.1 hypothetical protein Enr8_27030 [Blastopirellula retiformator]